MSNEVRLLINDNVDVKKMLNDGLLKKKDHDFKSIVFDVSKPKKEHFEALSLLTNILKKKTVQHLKLVNGIIRRSDGTPGFYEPPKALLELFGAEPIESLEIYSNNITNARFLLIMNFRNDVLTHLNLSHNKLEIESVKLIAKRIKDGHLPALVYLNMEYNRIISFDSLSCYFHQFHTLLLGYQDFAVYTERIQYEFKDIKFNRKLKRFSLNIFECEVNIFTTNVLWLCRGIDELTVNINSSNDKKNIYYSSFFTSFTFFDSSLSCLFIIMPVGNLARLTEFAKAVNHSSISFLHLRLDGAETCKSGLLMKSLYDIIFNDNSNITHFSLSCVKGINPNVEALIPVMANGILDYVEIYNYNAKPETIKNVNYFIKEHEDKEFIIWDEEKNTLINN